MQEACMALLICELKSQEELLSSVCDLRLLKQKLPLQIERRPLCSQGDDTLYKWSFMKD